MKEVYNFLNEAGTFYLGTVAVDKPVIRPFGVTNIFEDKLYFQTGRVKSVYKQLKNNCNVSIVAMNKGKWIRIEAQAIEDNRIEAEISMLDNNPEIKKMYSAGDGNTVVFYLKNVKATIYSFTEEPHVIEF